MYLAHLVTAPPICSVTAQPPAHNFNNMSGASAYVDVEAEVSSDDEDFQVSADEDVSEDEEEEARLNKEMIADEDEIEAERQRVSPADRRVAESTEDLVDDDYLLLEDHHGVKFNRKRKGLDTANDGKRKRLQRQTASDDEVDDVQKPKDDDGNGGYSEDDYGLSGDEDDDQNEDWLVDDVSGARKNKRQPSGKAAQFGEAGDIFGDMTEFLASTAEVAAEEDNHTVQTMRRESQIEPSIAARHMVTAADEVIRNTDLPERLQKRVSERPAFDEDPKELMFQEAEWIHQYKFQQLAPTTAVPVIMAVLEMIRLHNFDVPHIQLYQKDYYIPLQSSDIWIIDRCDKKWDHIVSKRTSVAKQLEKHAPNEVDLLGQLSCAVDEEEIEEVRNYVSSRTDPITSSIKRPQRRNTLSHSAHDHLLEPITESMFLEPRKVGQNFRARFLQHEPSDPELAPEQLAEGAVCERFPTPASALAAARAICAANTALDPFVRSAIRDRFMDIAVICTTPTQKGKMAIDWGHEYFEIKHLVDKPIRAFLVENTSQFALLTCAESEGFIKSTIRFPQMTDGVNLLAMEFCDLFQSMGFSRISQLWNEQRRLVFDEMVDRHLFKVMENGSREKLSAAALEVIAARAANKLSTYINISPISRERQVVCACSVGDRGDPSYVAVIDRQGLLVDHITLPNMKMFVRRSNVNVKVNVHDLKSKKGQDARRFRSFIERYSPVFVAISADYFEGSREFMAEAKIALQSRAGSIPIEYVDPAAARIAMNSRRMVEELSEHPTLLRQAVALARYVQDPLSEVCAIAATHPVDLISLPLDPLQKCVPREHMLRCLQQCLIDLVNHVGVDVNLAVSQPHLQGSLSFISGLGPRKSKLLVDFIKRNGAVSSREDLRKVFGDCVWRNSSGFLRIIAPPFSQMLISPLDDSRIHPEHYMLSDRVVLNALDIDIRSDDAGGVRDALILRLRAPALRYKLDELDLYAYAQAMEKEGEGRFTETLQLIKSELKAPFTDNIRHPFTPLTPEILFHLLTGEQPGVTLYRGQIVDVVITSSNRSGVMTRLDSGIPAFIPISAYQDEITALKAEQGEDAAFKQIQMLTKPVWVTIKARVVSIDLSRFRVDLTASERDLNDKTSWETPLRNDIYNVEVVDVDDGPKPDTAILAKAPARKFIPRNIDHPLFSNVDREKAESMLKDAPVGDVVIRPSRLGTHQLTITWKIAEDIYVNIAVAEHDKPHEVSKALGRRLSIEDEHFEDLDEILARYIRPLTKFAETIVQHGCFRFGSESEIDRLLMDDKEDQPSRIPYFFGFSTEHPGLFVFSYLPSKRVHHELVKLTPKGFRFQKRVFTKPSQIVAWFKAQFAKVVKARAKKAAVITEQQQKVPNDARSRSRWGEAKPSTTFLRQTRPEPPKRAPPTYPQHYQQFQRQDRPRY